MDDMYTFNKQEIEIIEDLLYLEKFNINKSIVNNIQLLDSEMELILYYDDLIKVDWCVSAHTVYKKNKEIYLANAHKFYAYYLNELIDLKEKLSMITGIISRLLTVKKEDNNDIATCIKRLENSKR